MSLNSKTTTVLVTLVLVVFTLILYENGFTSQIAFTPGGSFRAQTVIGKKYRSNSGTATYDEFTSLICISRN